MEVNLVVEGTKFMMLGMGIVFLFLALMIFAMNVMSKIIHRYFPEPHPAPAKPKTAAPAGNDKLKKVAAIATAIHHHNKNK